MRSAFIRSVTLTALTTTAITFAAPAMAQDAAAAVDNASSDNGEIIVSARRRDETLQSTPVAITAVNAASLENKASVNIGDLTGAAPNLLITQQNSGAAAANLSIRGLTYADIEKSQTPTVGVVIDGVTIGTNTGQLVDSFDIEQIEVLRGPQGTLFGANTIGGVLNIRRTKPTMRPGAKLEASYGRWNTWNAKAIVNYGNDENWGLKAWYTHNQTDGFYNNVIQKRSGGWSKGDNYGASLLVKSGAFDGQLTVEQTVQKFDPVVSNLANKSEVFCAFEAAIECNRNNTSDLYTVFSAPAESNYRARAATLEMNVDLDVVKLTSITGYRHSKEAQTQDFDGSSTDLYYVDRRQHYTQWSQELRAAGELFPSFDYVVGGYWFNSRYDLTQWSRVFGFNPTVPPIVFDKNQQLNVGKSESFAVFGDFNWSILDNVRLSFGGRWSHDHKKLRNGFATSGLFPMGDASFSKFTPKVGLDWRPNSDTMVYASWSRGYRSGGFSPRAAESLAATTPFQPETVDAYEVGAKFALLDRKLQLNFAAFSSDYKNMQQNLTIPGGPTGNQTLTGNVAGGAIIRGLEFDGTFRPVEGLKFTATAAYMKSHFRNFQVGCAAGTGIGVCNYSNNRLIYAPEFSGSFEGEYTVPTSFGKVVATAGIRHIAPYDEQISQAVIPTSITAVNNIAGNDPRVRTKTQNLVDASVTFNFNVASADAYLRFYGRNLANSQTTTHAFTVAGLWSFGMALEPRTYGATVGVKF
jgi:iron complex outermembrane receptor protein